ncbi:MAG: hypothetical protein PSY14_12390 [bacterium]|nr:hypothetical protein [bacterium]
MTNQSALEAHYGVCDRLDEYRLLPVFRNITKSLGEEIIDLWRRNHALPAGSDPAQRVSQVVLAAIDADDKLVAVSTAYRAPFSHSGLQGGTDDEFYYFRTFVQPGDRRHNLPKKLTNSTYDHLNTLPPEGRPKGVVIVAENPKLTKKLLEHELGPFGWVHIGQDARGKQVFRRDF